MNFSQKLTLSVLLLLCPLGHSQSTIQIINGHRVQTPDDPLLNAKLYGATPGQQVIIGAGGVMVGGTASPFNPRGAWAASTSYAVNDLFTYQGGSYLVTTAFTSGSTFSTANTFQIAAPGATGVAGTDSPAQVVGTAGAAGADVLSELGLSGVRNLLNPNGSFTVGYDINATDGTLLTVGSYVAVTDFIPVAGISVIVANHDMAATGSGGVVCYDGTKTYMAAAATGRVNAGSSVTLPAGCTYIRTSFTGGIATGWQNSVGIYNASTLPGSFISYGYVYPDSTYVAGLKAIAPTPGAFPLSQYVTQVGAAMAMQPVVRNMFDPTRYTAGVTLDPPDAGYSTSTYAGVSAAALLHSFCCAGFSGLVPVLPGATYTIQGQPSPNNSTGVGAFFFDVNQNAIAGTMVSAAAMTLNQTFTAPATAAYFGFPVGAAYLNTVMLVPGTTILPQYIPFAQVPSTTQNRSPWYGKTMSILGDSYCYTNIWQQAVAAYHGMKIKLQDCRVGRPIGQMFECYAGGVPSGGNLGSTTVSSVGGPCGTNYNGSGIVNNGTSGNTFFQDVAGSDLLLIELDTNDNYDSALGTATDAPGTNTTGGALQTQLQALLAALPATTRVVWLGPIQVSSTVGNRAAMMRPISQLTQTVVNSYGIPFIDNIDNSGFNLYSDPTLMNTDGIHPTTAGFTLYAQYPLLMLNQIPPLH